MKTASINGFDMSYELRGEGPPLVLLHGFTGTGQDWRHVFDLDALGREHTVIAPDARGHGGSTNPDGSFSHRQCADDLLALLDRLGVERFSAIGASLGGNTLLHVATRAPDQVDTMVLSGSPSYFPEPARAIMRAFTADSRTPDEWTELRAKHVRGDDQIRALLRHVREMAERHDDMSFTPPRLAGIRARTLLVNGDRDPLYPVEMFVDMYRAIPACSMWILPDAGHAPLFGEHRAAIGRAALDFVRAHRRGADPGHARSTIMDA